jgi:hypothetical protein
MPAPAVATAVAIFLNGYQVMLPTAAIQRGDTVLVPVKGVFDRLGAKIAWSAETKTVTISAPDVRLVLSVGSAEGTLNGHPLALQAPPEIREDSTLVPLRLVATALGADIAWDQRRRRVYVQTGPVGPVTATTVAALIERPYDWVGRLVLLSGEYMGWEPSPFSPSTRNGTPVSRRDWVLRDPTGEIYCRGDVQVPSPFALTPYSHIGRRLLVAGVAKLARRGFIFVEPREIVELSGTEGLVCSVTTSRRAYVIGETLRIRLTVANPFASSSTVPCEPGVSHDLVVRDRVGTEVWRLSVYSPPQRAPGPLELAPGQDLQVEELWQPGPDVPPGRYTIEGEWGGALRSYPHMIALVPRED